MGEILAALAGAGVTVAALAGVLRWGGDRIADRLGQRVTHTYDKLLEQERARLQSLTDIAGAAATIPSASFIAGYSRRLEALHNMWSTLLEIRRMFGRAVGIYDLLLERELKDVTAADKIVAGLPVGTDAFLARYPDPPDCEQERPFLGEYIWLRFFVYRAVTIRLAWRVSDRLAQDELLPWDRGFHGDDDPVVQLLRSVLADERVNTARRQPIGGPNYALRIIESEILIEVDNVLSGSRAALLSVAEGNKAADAIWEFQKATRGSDAT